MIGSRHSGVRAGTAAGGAAAVAVALVLAVLPGRANGKAPTPAEAKSFWSFRPVKRPDVPKVNDAGWVRNPIDAFVLAKLEEKGWKPAPPAGKAQLIRRAYYDLTG